MTTGKAPEGVTGTAGWPEPAVAAVAPGAAARSVLRAYAPVLDAVRGIGWPARERVRSAIAGPHPSTVRGTSAEFVEYRPYRQGDDPRRIDWKLLARTDRVYTRLSEEHAILPTVVVVDASASMAFPPKTLDKWEFARRLAVALAAVARHRGDPAGLVVVGEDGMRVIPPQTRRTVLEEMMRALDVAPAGSPALAPAAAEAFRLGRRVVLITDFLGDAEALLASAKAAMASGREVYAVHVVDPGELDPDPKKLLVTDPEAPSIRRPLPARVRREYQRRFGEWRERLAREWRRAGAVYAMVVPGAEPLRRTVRRITEAGGAPAGVATGA
jgi:uncharacterized protein (DUF58 family)